MKRENHHGRHIRIEFEIKAPDAAVTDGELEEWLRYRFGDNGSMKVANPLSDNHTTEPIFGTFEWSLT